MTFISQFGGSTACAGSCVCSHVPIGCCDSWSADGVDSPTGLPVADSGVNGTSAILLSLIRGRESLAIHSATNQDINMALWLCVSSLGLYYALCEWRS